MKEFRALGATLVEIEPFGLNEARYCNKIRQLETEAFLDADFVILTDADIAFVVDPADLVRRGRFRAKTVDAPNPAEEIWSKLFLKTSLMEKISTVALDMFAETRTFNTNFNGGLYVMPATMARNLHPIWERHALSCLDQPDLLGAYLHHADQLGLGLALAESGDPIELLPFGGNLPTHFSAEKLSRVERQDIWCIHYHSHMDQHGLPEPVGVDWIDAIIRRLRTTIESERRKGFLNELFWEFRYATNP